MTCVPQVKMWWNLSSFFDCLIVPIFSFVPLQFHCMNSVWLRSSLFSNILEFCSFSLIIICRFCNSQMLDKFGGRLVIPSAVRRNEPTPRGKMAPLVCLLTHVRLYCAALVQYLNNWTRSQKPENLGGEFQPKLIYFTAEKQIYRFISHYFFYSLELQQSVFRRQYLQLSWATLTTWMWLSTWREWGKGWHCREQTASSPQRGKKPACGSALRTGCLTTSAVSTPGRTRGSLH